MKSRLIWIFAALGILGVWPAQGLLAQSLEVSKPTAGTDFIEYWAAGRLLWTGGNPYSPVQLGAVQSTVTGRAAAPLIMWNPPWTLSFIVPFGALSFTVSQFIWLLLHVGLICLSAQIFWRIYVGSAEKLHTAWLLTFTFIPILFALMLGQVTPLMAAGLASFLYFERRDNGFVSGASTVLISVKPQLCYLFWLALLCWVWRCRSWRIALGALSAGLVVALIPALFNPAIYSSYITLCTTGGLVTPLDWAAPTLGNALRMWISPDRSALQFAPMAVGVAWLAYYWQRHKHSWNWTERLPILLLVSVSTGAYAWTFDHVVLLPALMQSAGWMRRPLARYPCGLVVLYFAINAVYLTGKFFVLNDFWYFWMAPLFLLTYFLLQKRVLA